MSITFWIPQAPVVRVAPFDDEPDYLAEEPAAPFLEMNLSNSNAFDLLQLVAPWADPNCGRWEGDTIHRVRKQVMILLNRTPEKYLDAPVEGHNFVHMGRSMDYVTRRLTEMLTLLSVASEHGFYVSYG